VGVSGQYSATFKDFDSEKATTGLHVAVLSAANYDAQETLRTNFTAALVAMSIGELQNTQYGNFSLQSIDKTDDVNAQRERKWRVDYHDATTFKPYRIEIPCADADLLDVNDRAHAEIGDAGIVDAFITAFEAYALSEVGNAIVVDEITMVGRNV
jgi:hypothetical protein